MASLLPGLFGLGVFSGRKLLGAHCLGAARRLADFGVGMPRRSPFLLPPGWLDGWWLAPPFRPRALRHMRVLWRRACSPRGRARRRSRLAKNVLETALRGAPVSSPSGSPLPLWPRGAEGAALPGPAGGMARRRSAASPTLVHPVAALASRGLRPCQAGPAEESSRDQPGGARCSSPNGGAGTPPP